MTPLRLHRVTVQPEMIDYNGHLTEGWYALIFGDATDALYEHVGAGAAWRATTGCSLYTLEAHLRYLREVPVGAALTIATQVIGVDQKRVILAHEMERNGEVAATGEILAICVDTRAGRSTVLDAGLHERLSALCTPDPPDYCGRRIALPGARQA